MPQERAEGADSTVLIASMLLCLYTSIDVIYRINNEHMKVLETIEDAELMHSVLKSSETKKFLHTITISIVPLM